MIRSNQQTMPRSSGQGASVESSCDVRGFRLNCAGDIGGAHRIAHEHFDCGEMVQGHQRLDQYLSGHNGEGSAWVHLHFHMAVFELALDDWHAAYNRFWTRLLPVAATTFDALTDAPALLWRLQFSAPTGLVLPWKPVRRTALAALSHHHPTFVQLHQLLALAGAGDTWSITQWINRQSHTGAALASDLPRRFAALCLDIARTSYASAAVKLRDLRPELTGLDGSHAQLTLFDQLDCWLEGAAINLVHRNAA